MKTHTKGRKMHYMHRSVTETKARKAKSRQQLTRQQQRQQDPCLGPPPYCRRGSVPGTVSPEDWCTSYQADPAGRRNSVREIAGPAT